jgi:hypothetical protein
MTRLLIDTDVFCKLGVADLLGDALDVFGLKMADCARLPALPYMLRRGGLVRKYGAPACNALAPIADSIPPLLDPAPELLGELADLDTVDVGEAQLFAAAAKHEYLVLTGDKRALLALCKLERFRAALHGRIVVLEAILLELCQKLGADTLRARIRPAAGFDKVLAVCFSDANPDPTIGLRSYFGAKAKEVEPLVLWTPQMGAEL